MKTPKKPSKEPSIPSQDEYRRFNVLQEQILSKFQTFGEAQSHTLERLDRIEPRLDKLDQKADVLESAIRSHTDAICADAEDARGLKEAVHQNTEATRANTEAIHSMQADLKNINQRLEVVEAKVAS